LAALHKVPDTGAAEAWLDLDSERKFLLRRFLLI
jgi:hypothetical protein